MPSRQLNVTVLAGELVGVGEPIDLADGSSMVELRIRCAEGIVPIWWPSNARVPRVGSEVIVRATVRHRLFRAGGRVVARTEVVAHELRNGRSGGPRRRLLARVTTELAEVAS